LTFEIEVDKSGRFCLVRLRGRMDISEYESAMHAFQEHPGVVPGMATVYDLREAQMGHLNADDFRTMSVYNEKNAARRGPARIAIVVPDAVHYGLARMYQVLGATPNLDTQVFTDHEKAVQWAQSPTVALDDAP